jgi:hypothetical protein
MKYLVIIAVMTAVMLVSYIGCGQQGAGNSPSGSTEQTTSPGESREPPTTTEETTVLGRLDCPYNSTEGAVYDYALGIGEKASPVEQARRKFSKRIEEGDKVEIAEHPGGPTVGYYGEELRTVRVVRDGRVVALIHYKEGGGSGGGWLLDSYEACSDF